MVCGVSQSLVAPWRHAKAGFCKMHDNITAIEHVREQFPAALESIYLSVCDRGIMSDRTAAALDAYGAAMQGASGLKSDHEKIVAQARERFARLINAQTSEIALVSNVSDGMNSIAWAMPWQAGDNLVIVAELEHPNNLYPWLRLKQLGVELRDVAPVNGRIDPEAVLAAIDARTRIVSCASVTFSPGLRTDLAAIGKGCRDRGVFFMVDAVQSVGILKHDVEAEYIDGLTTSTSKGLLGSYGCGFLYCRSEWANRLTPAYLSRTAVAVSQATPSEMGSQDYTLEPGARRFEVGSHNFAGAYAANASLGMLLEIGPETIESHVMGLAEKLAQGLAELGLPVFCSGIDKGLSHIVTVGKLGEGGHAVTQDERLQNWSNHLKSRNVIHTIRRGQVRFALHLYNAPEDVERVLGMTKDYLAADT
jgi:cysteine desulfurase / selenocysteine lyase